jgi:hypothetical protein
MTNKVPSKRGVRFLLAEDVRQEAGGKFSLLGVFPGEKIFVGGSLASGTPPNVAFVLASLAFVFIVTEGEGRFDGRFIVIAPDGKTAVADTKIDGIEIRGQISTVGSAAKPFIGPSFGTYTVQLEIGSAKFKFSFDVLKAPVSRKKRP